MNIEPYDINDSEDFETLAAFFSVLSDAKRLKIVLVLFEGELCVCDIADKLNAKQPSISQHLKILWQAKILKKRKVGLHIYYSLDSDIVKQIYLLGATHVEK